MGEGAAGKGDESPHPHPAHLPPTHPSVARAPPAEGTLSWGQACGAPRLGEEEKTNQWK